jgi:hypothetical protein
MDKGFARFGGIGKMGSRDLRCSFATLNDAKKQRKGMQENDCCYCGNRGL